MFIKKVPNNTAISNNKKRGAAQTASARLRATHGQATSNGMHIVDVIPLSRGMSRETLSYFTARPAALGDLALVPLRRKEIPAIVVAIKSAASAKTDIKQSAYGLRKITRITAPHFFLPEFISAAKKSGEYFAGSTGAVIESFTPKAILDALIKGALSVPLNKAPQSDQEKNQSETYILQAQLKDRLATYKGIVREEFAKGRSVFLLVPSADDAPRVLSIIGKGIEDRVHIFHGGLSRRALAESWQNILTNERPVCVIGTGMSLSLPRHDIGAILIEQEWSWAYKQERRPFLDTRRCARHLAEALGARCILGAAALSVETLYEREQGKVSDFIPPMFHILSSAETTIVDMKNTHSPLQLTPKTFTVISDELKRAIEIVREQHEHIFIFASRKGLFPITICGDCGTVVSCVQCAAPLVLHTKIKKTADAADPPGSATDSGRAFLCRACRKTQSVTDRCKNCDSWRLAPLGAGTERVEEEIRRLFPTIKIVRVDKDKTPTRAKAEKSVAAFLKSPGSVLVGTELALAALEKKIAVTAAVSIDPIFAIPSFRIHERVFHILLALRDKANEKCIIQTRIPELPLLRYVQNGNIADFYKEEISERRALKYPPFTALIKLTMSGTKDSVEKSAARISEQFREYDTYAFPAFISKVRGKHIMHVVIKTEKDKWPDEKLRALLSELSPAISINVEPEHLL